MSVSPRAPLDSESQEQRARSGRRPGDSGTRDAILRAARRQFAEQGYDRTSLRSVAIEAGVDPGLVTHFHRNKQKLFASVVQLPFDPAEVLPPLLAGDLASAGDRLAGFIMTILETPESRSRIVGLVRAASTEPEAARLVRELITVRLFVPFAEGIGAADAELRASLIGTQVVGLVMARYVVGVEPLASQPAHHVAHIIGPVLQQYLTDPLPADPDAAH